MHRLFLWPDFFGKIDMPAPNSSSAAPPPPIWDATPSDFGVRRYAGFWLRVVAAIVDAVALTVIWKVIEFFLPRSPLPSANTTDLAETMAYLNTLLPPTILVGYALVVWAYFAIQESSSVQATLGKRLLGIRVSTASVGRLTLVTATMRSWPTYIVYLAWAISAGLGILAIFVSIISCLTVAFSSRKQGLHDKMAGALLLKL